MEIKKILGLDIGTNSIGAALINLPKHYENYGIVGNIEWIGSRIIPESNYSKAFEVGQKSSPKNMTPAGTRRQARGSRRLKHRYKLRRTRLIKVFKALGWIDESFPLDESRKFKQNINENGYSLKISDYLPFSEQTISEFEKELGIEDNKSKKGKSIVPEDWIIYYLRKKALENPITIPELVRIIYVLNQRRGFKSSRKDLKDTSVLPYKEFIKLKECEDFGETGIETQFVSIIKIKSVTYKEEKKDKRGNVVSNIYTIEAEDTRMQTWEESRKKEPDWAKEVNEKNEKIDKKEFTFLVTQKIDKNGKHTQNKPQMPNADDWALCTTALSEKIEENKQHPGEYFFDELKKAYIAKRNYKIRQYPIYRWRYQKELEDIWKKQCELNLELKKLNSDKATLTKLAEILYPTQTKNNMPKLAEFENKNLLHIISNDIIYYQRELKSQKNSISECRYEKRIGKGKNENGEWIESGSYGLKCIPRSSPLFQEFRIWQDIHNIRIFKKEEKVEGKTKIDVDVTSLYIDDTIKERLFDLFNSKASISETDILKLLKENKKETDIVIAKKDEEHSHRINLFANRDSLKGNETLSRYRTVLKKAEFDGESVLADKEKLMKLWHIDYSITSSDEEKSKQGITTALNKLLPGNSNKEKAVELFTKLPELKKEYGSYSACAIKKLLPVMRCGKYWTAIEKLVFDKENELNEVTKKKQRSEIEDYLKYLKSVNPRAAQIKERLDDINHSIRRLNEIADDDVQKQVLKSFIEKDDLTKGLNTYQAGYLIYDKHSEKDKTPINSVEEFGKYIQKEIPNNSLRNPVVEQVVRETMFLVRDIWKQYGEIDEIHIELGRNLKNNTDQRKKIADAQKGNFDEKQRIKKLLYELMNDGFEQYIDDDEAKPFKFENGNFEWETKIQDATFEVKPNPESPIDIDRFRIWRNLTNKSEIDWAKKVKDEKIPTEQEIKKYALWLSQNCRSPYTGKIIPLSKLFDTAQYEIEHVIPRAKMKNDSYNNLVISEWGVNKAKDKQLAANFISASNAKCKYGDTEYKLFTYDEYEVYCKETFKFQKAKLKNLLATEVPEDFIERQLNDTRYIGRKLSELLVPVAKNENGIIFTGGSITSELKKNWGLQKEWKKLMRPRFERLYQIEKTKLDNEYAEKDENNNLKKDENGDVIIDNNRKDDYGKALVKIQYIKQNEKDRNDIDFNVPENPHLDLKRIDHRHHALDALIIAATTREHIRYLNTLSAADTDDEIRKFKQSLVKGKIRDFKLPWDKFTEHAKNKLEELVVSFKTNNKIISQPKNRTAYFKTENGKVRKEFKEQKANSRWLAVRRSMFKEPLGVIWLKEIKEVSVFDAFKIHIEKKIADSDKEKRKTASYVYDKQARQIIDDIVSKSRYSIDEQVELLKEIKNFLEKNSQKVATDKINKKGEIQQKTIYKLNRIDYEKIKVAHFVSYKTKRMALTKKEYVENLTIEKMTNDFPYFSFVNKLYFNSLPDKKKELIEKANFEISENKKQSALNQLFLEHILEYNNNAKEAFNAEGIEKLNKKAIENRKIGKEIKSITRLDGTVEIEDMFNGGFYETDKGAMAYFVMYENQQTKERTDFRSIATHKAIEKIVKGLPIAEDKVGFDKITLSPGDLVYIPTNEERGKIKEGIDIDEAVDWKGYKHLLKRIYKVVSFSKKDLLCVKSEISDYIIPYDRKEKNKGEIGWDNKSATTMEEDMSIKDVCIKLNVNRLGNISPVKKKSSNESIENIHSVSEPEVAYQKMTLKKFNSFEEMNEADAQSAANIDSLEHVRNTTELIKKIYTEELKNPFDKKIKFR